MRGDEFSTRTEHFNCPNCGERISVVLDLSVNYQRYSEDCEVCCKPIEISYRSEEGEIISFDVGKS